MQATPHQARATRPQLGQRFQKSLLATLAAMALAACGGGEDDAMADALAKAQSDSKVQQQMQLMAASVSTVAMTKVGFTNSAGQALTGFLFRDVSSATPRNAAVVLMHGCSGVWSNGVVNTEAQPPQKALSHIHRRWGANLARAGYSVLLVDSFTSRDLTNECGNGTAGLNEAVVRPLDALAGRQWLVANGVAGDRIALMGWSNGGSATLATMDRTNEGTPGARPFREAFAFYPGCGLLNEFGGGASSTATTTWLPYAPVTIHHADQDPLYTDSRCANRVAGATALGAGVGNGNAVGMTVHAGARHSFDQIDLSKALAAPHTAADQTAQTVADAAVMTRLATLFPAP